MTTLQTTVPKKLPTDAKPRHLEPLSEILRLRLAGYCEQQGLTRVADAWDVSFMTLKRAVAGDGLTTPVREYFVCKLTHQPLKDLD